MLQNWSPERAQAYRAYMQRTSAVVPLPLHCCCCCGTKSGAPLAHAGLAGGN